MLKRMWKFENLLSNRKLIKGEEKSGKEVPEYLSAKYGKLGIRD